jgi:hypothetical protein
MTIYHAILHREQQNLVSTLIKLRQIYKLVPLRLETQGDTKLYVRECCIHHCRRYSIKCRIISNRARRYRVSVAYYTNIPLVTFLHDL